MKIDTLTIEVNVFRFKYIFGQKSKLYFSTFLLFDTVVVCGSPLFYIKSNIPILLQMESNEKAKASTIQL